MAEEQKAEEEGEKKSSTLIKNLIMLCGAILVPAIIAVGVFNFVLKPKLGGEEEVDKGPVVTNAFPETMGNVTFDKQQISVQTDDPDVVAPLLITKITLSCQDDATITMVGLHKDHFAAMILKLHQGRTRTELNDPLVQNSIREQIKQQANNLLGRLSPEMELKVLEALHVEFMIVDL
jgi:flagellar basal body-associated protein FliL